MADTNPKRKIKNLKEPRIKDRTPCPHGSRIGCMLSIADAILGRKR